MMMITIVMMMMIMMMMMMMMVIMMMIMIMIIMWPCTINNISNADIVSRKETVHIRVDCTVQSVVRFPIFEFRRFTHSYIYIAIELLTISD